MSKGFDMPSNKHLGNPHNYWKAPQKNCAKIIAVKEPKLNELYERDKHNNQRSEV